MKPSSKYDFPVSVRCQTWEEEPHLAPYYEGILDVTLNYQISLMFVPQLAREPGSWPPVLPDDVDAIGSKMEARLITVALSKYTVTVDASRAGQVESLAGPGYEDPTPRTLFFVGPEEFDTFSKELSRLAEERPAVHNVWKLSEIMDLEVVRYLLHDLLMSPHIAPEDLALLGR